MKRALVRVVLALCLLLTRAAAAEPVATLVLIADDPADAVAARLERDLRGLGFNLVVLGATPENSSDVAALERTARSLGSMATVRVLPLDEGARLWVMDPTTGRSVTRELVLPAGSTPDPNEVALGTLELLRASMLELRPPVAPSRPTPGESKALPSKPLEPKPPVFSLAGGAGAELGLHSFGASATGVLATWVKLHGPWGARGFAALPISSEHADVPEGGVEVRPSLFGIGLALGQGLDNWWLEPRASWGIVFAHVETRGIAKAPLGSSSAAVWLGGGYALLGASLHLTHDVRLDLDLTGIVLPTPAVIIVDRREAARWGAPAGMLTLALEVSASP